MNWNKLDKTWHVFSKLKNLELKYKERNQGNVIQSHYLINTTQQNKYRRDLNYETLFKYYFVILSNLKMVPLCFT